MSSSVASSGPAECQCPWRCRIEVEIARISGPTLALRIPMSLTWVSPALTRAEADVVELAVRGYSNEAIALRRRCARRTVANQLSCVYAKLGISGRRELRAQFAAHHGGAVRPRSFGSEPGIAPSPVSASAPCAVRLVRSRSCLGTMVEAMLSGQLSLHSESSRDGERSFVGTLNPPELAARVALSAREQQILVLSGEGASNKMSAYLLGISTSAVSTYLTRGRKKLGLEDAEQLIGQLAAASQLTADRPSRHCAGV